MNWRRGFSAYFLIMAVCTGALAVGYAIAFLFGWSDDYWLGALCAGLCALMILCRRYGVPWAWPESDLPRLPYANNPGLPEGAFWIEINRSDGSHGTALVRYQDGGGLEILETRSS
jgi:hypothetical protein